ncbi:MAG: hypothetical protein ACI9MB_001664, partial [Verrucomicrobiales bacterium]
PAEYRATTPRHRCRRRLRAVAQQPGRLSSMIFLN